MISEWTTNYEAGRSTGVLLWDLSAAFDTIDLNLFCEKLTIYGVAKREVQWFRTFLTDCEQKVTVGSSLSEPISTSIGCPQGSLLSPLIFLIYIADIDLLHNVEQIS